MWLYSVLHSYIRTKLPTKVKTKITGAFTYTHHQARLLTHNFACFSRAYARITLMSCVYTCMVIGNSVHLYRYDVRICICVYSGCSHYTIERSLLEGDHFIDICAWKVSLNCRLGLTIASEG